ncbi:MAG: type II toxin-antitoxin system PemK/MazF family toxin [Sporichthyaceae bacterium]
MRGDVYELEPRPARGHEQTGDRYGVILQADYFPWSTVVVAPTSASAKPGPIRPQVHLEGEDTVVLVDQMQAVDPERRLGRMVGRLGYAEMAEVETAMRRVLDL